MFTYHHVEKHKKYPSTHGNDFQTFFFFVENFPLILFKISTRIRICYVHHFQFSQNDLVMLRRQFSLIKVKYPGSCFLFRLYLICSIITLYVCRSWWWSNDLPKSFLYRERVLHLMRNWIKFHGNYGLPKLGTTFLSSKNGNIQLQSCIISVNTKIEKGCFYPKILILLSFSANKRE